MKRDAAQDTMIDIRRTVIWVILLGAGGLLVGCDQSPLVPFEPSWDEVRYHEFGPSGVTDLVFQRSGSLQFSSVRAEEERERDGLLSEGTIHDLDRAVSGVEDKDEAGTDEPCHEGAKYFVSIIKDGSVISFSGSACAELPEGQASLVEMLQSFVAEIWRLNPKAVAYRHMGNGRAELPHGLQIVGSLDELAEILKSISRDRPVVWPPVDFDREWVLGYVGEQELLDIRIGGISTTDEGQIHLNVDEFHGIGSCPATEGRPYDFVKVKRFDGDFVIETQITETPCESLP
jgi:hypothetical protein